MFNGVEQPPHEQLRHTIDELSRTAIGYANDRADLMTAGREILDSANPSELDRPVPVDATALSHLADVLIRLEEQGGRS